MIYIKFKKESYIFIMCLFLGWKATAKQMVKVGWMIQ